MLPVRATVEPTIQSLFITTLVATSALKSFLRQQLQPRISIKAGMMCIDMYIETVIALKPFLRQQLLTHIKQNGRGRKNSMKEQ